MLKDKDPLITEYMCQDCGGSKWKLYLSHEIDDSTKLLIVCGNNECVQNKRRSLGADHNTMIIWGDFDITNQGFDEKDAAHRSGGLLN